MRTGWVLTLRESESEVRRRGRKLPRREMATTTTSASSLILTLAEASSWLSKDPSDAAEAAAAAATTASAAASAPDADMVSHVSARLMTLRLCMGASPGMAPLAVAEELESSTQSSPRVCANEGKCGSA